MLWIRQHGDAKFVKPEQKPKKNNKVLLKAMPVMALAAVALSVGDYPIWHHG